MQLRAAADALLQLHALCGRQMLTLLGIGLLQQQQQQQQQEGAAAAAVNEHAAVVCCLAIIHGLTDDDVIQGLVTNPGSPWTPPGSSGSSGGRRQQQQQQFEGVVTSAGNTWRGLLEGTSSVSMYLPLQRFLAGCIRSMLDSNPRPLAGSDNALLTAGQQQQQQQQQQQVLQQLYGLPWSALVPEVLAVKAWLVQSGGQLWIRNGDDNVAAARLYYQVGGGGVMIAHDAEGMYGEGCGVGFGEVGERGH
jgi:hypothetical protein